MKWFFIEDAAEKAATKEETFKRADFFLGKLEGLVKKNGGYFVGGKVNRKIEIIRWISIFITEKYFKNKSSRAEFKISEKKKTKN